MNSLGVVRQIARSLFIKLLKQGGAKVNWRISQNIFALKARGHEEVSFSSCPRVL